jgi:hypothetical protein
LNYILKISSFKKLTLAFSLLFSIALISIPTFDLAENILSQELYTDYESEKNNKEVDNENELDEYINDSLFSSYTKTAFDFIASKSAKDYQILFLVIDSQPPDLI